MIAYALSQSLEFLVMGLGFWYGSRLIASGMAGNTVIEDQEYMLTCPRRGVYSPAVLRDLHCGHFRWPSRKHTDGNGSTDV